MAGRAWTCKFEKEPGALGDAVEVSGVVWPLRLCPWSPQVSADSLTSEKPQLLQSHEGDSGSLSLSGGPWTPGRLWSRWDRHLSSQVPGWEAHGEDQKCLLKESVTQTSG